MVAATASRVADIKLLNQRRWQEHVRAQQTPQPQQLGARALGVAPARATVPTAGSLFNRPNPVGYDHENKNKEYNTLPYNRERDQFLPSRGERWAIRPDGSYQHNLKKPEKNVFLGEVGDGTSWERNKQRRDPRTGELEKLMPVYGVDITSVNHASYRKYRIPNTSVVNKVGDVRVPCICWGVRMTAAQWSKRLRAQTHRQQPQPQLTAPLRALQFGGPTCCASSRTPS